MSAVRELTSVLIKAGMDPADAAAMVARAGMEMAPPADTRTAGAKRQAAYRERNKTSPNVTEVTEPEASPNVTNRNETSQSDAASLSKKEKKEEGKEVREPRKARASQMLDGWHPGENAWQTAIDRIGQPRAVGELQKFKNHAADKGRVSKSWDAAWRNWVDRALDYSGGTGTKGNPNGRRTVHDAAKDLTRTLERLAEFDEPAPSGVRIEEGGNAFRLLPPR